VPDRPTVAQAALRTDPAVRAAFAAADARYRSYLAGEAELQTPAWRAALAAAGGPPAVLWLDQAGRLVHATAAPTADKILADLRTLKGGK
jgi:hypothetical protein